MPGLCVYMSGGGIAATVSSQTRRHCSSINTLWFHRQQQNGRRTTIILRYLDFFCHGWRLLDSSWWS